MELHKTYVIQSRERIINHIDPFQTARKKKVEKKKKEIPINRSLRKTGRYTPTREIFHYRIRTQQSSLKRDGACNRADLLAAELLRRPETRVSGLRNCTRAHFRSFSKEYGPVVRAVPKTCREWTSEPKRFCIVRA